MRFNLQWKDQDAFKKLENLFQSIERTEELTAQIILIVTKAIFNFTSSV